jgi:cysteine desulfurase/selenocysteine lyase
MCGPKGVGILYAKQELLEENGHSDDTINPVILGGGSVRDSTYESYYLLESPEKYEIGVQNYAGQIAAGEAVRYIQQVGFERIRDCELELNKFLTKQLLGRYEGTKWFKILGPLDSNRRGGILAFEVKRPNAVGIAEELSEKNNVMIRDGVFCVHSYANKLFGPNWLNPSLPDLQRMMYRVSVYFYNTIEECSIFLETLDNIFKERSYI